VSVHPASEEECDNSKHIFQKESGQIFNHFPQHHMKILLEYFNTKVGRRNIFKLATGNDSLHLDSNDNGVRRVNFATSKNLFSCYEHHVLTPNIHKHNWTSPDGKPHNRIGYVLTDRRWHSSILDVRFFRRPDYGTVHYLLVAKVKERLAVSKQSA
jgi:hypothetical protein